MEKYIFNEEGNKAGYRGGFEGKEGVAKIAHLSVPIGLALDSTYHSIVGGGGCNSTLHKNKYEDVDVDTELPATGINAPLVAMIGLVVKPNLTSPKPPAMLPLA